MVYYRRRFGCITLLQCEKITVEIRNNGNCVKRNCECVKSSARTVLVQTNLKLMLRPSGWTVTQGNVQESWCRNYIYSSLHPSYLSDSPQRCRFGKESSEGCNEPFKRQVHRVEQHTTNHRAAIRVVYNSQSLHSEAESNPILCFLPFHLLRNLFQPRFSIKINPILLIQ